MVPDVEGAKLIVVGNAMALTVFNEDALQQRYENYLKKLAGKPAVIPRDWYMASGAGETAVKYSGLTGVYTRFYRAEVPKDLVRQMGFASAFGTFMAGTSADLVAAQVLPGYGSWITHVLCSEKDANYEACARQYRPGVYQSSDGREVDSTLKEVSGGAVIDPTTFMLRNEYQVRGNSPGSASVSVQQATTPEAKPTGLPPQGSAPLPQRDEGEQLRKLNDLLGKGLITQAEYERKRKEILDRI